MLSVPLIGKGGPLGVLRAYGARGPPLHRRGRERSSQLIAAHGAVAIENAQAYQMLADLNQEKSKFVRVTTHELRAPAQVTESLLTALATGYAGQLTEGQSELVNRALRRLRLLQGLVDDLLDLAAGKVNLRDAERRAVTLQPIVVDVVRPLRVACAGEGPGAGGGRPAGPPSDLVRPGGPRPDPDEPREQRGEVHDCRQGERSVGGRRRGRRSW